MENTQVEMKKSVLSAVDSLEKNARNWTAKVATKANYYQRAANNEAKWNDEEREILQGCSEKCAEVQNIAAKSAKDLKDFSNQVLTASSEVTALSENNEAIAAEIQRIGSLMEQLGESIDSLGPEEDLDEEEANWLADARVNLVELEEVQEGLQESLNKTQALTYSVAEQANEIADEFALVTTEREVEICNTAEVLKSNIDSLYLKATTWRDSQNSFLEKASAFFSVIKDKCAEISNSIKSLFSRSNDACGQAEQLIDSCPSNRQSMGMRRF